MTKKVPQGLTLIELLLAVSLFSVIAVILYSVLFQSIQIWKRSEAEIEKTSDDRIVIKKISNDIRNAFFHSWVKFYGDVDQIYFCGLRRFKEEKSEPIRKLAKIHYIFIPKDLGANKKGLYLAEYPIEQSFQEIQPSPKIVSNVFKDFHFEYGYWDSTEKKIVPQSQWEDSKKIPRIVFLKWRTDNEFSQTVVLPLGELPDLKEASIENE